MKRALTCILAALMVFALLLPATNAQAAVLKGYTSKVDYDNTDPERYKVEIDLINQVITVYEQTQTGVYNNIVLQGLCTTGNEENPTGTGTYQLGHLKERFGYFVAFGQYAQYWTQVVRGVYIHSVMYDSKNITDMSRSAYNGLGKALSHGCVRVLPAHAKWIFYNCPPGTTCVITKGRAKNESLVKALKAQKPGISNAQPVDFKADPALVVAAAKADGVPLRTGFSSTKDTTVLSLKSGETVTVLQLGPSWCKVQTAKGKLGYVETRYLSMNPDAAYNPLGSYVAGEKIHLYQSVSTKSGQLATFEKGDAVQVIGRVDKYWLTAKSGDAYGYVRVKHLKSGSAATAPSAPVEQETIVPQNNVGYVKSGIIANFRAGPGTGFGVIAELAAGTQLQLLEVHGSWYKAIANGITGYLSASCVSY